MKKTNILSLAVSILIAFAVQLEARNHDPVLSEKDLRALNNKISGERTLDAIRHMAHFHRLQPGREYLQAAEWVAEQAKKSGLSDVRNSLLDIRNAVSAEFQPIPLKWVEDYIDLLVRADLVFWNAENLSSHI